MDLTIEASLAVVMGMGIGWIVYFTASALRTSFRMIESSVELG